MEIPGIDEETKRALEGIEENRAQLSKLGIIREKDLRKLARICEYVALEWKNARRLYPYPPHDCTHSIWVEDILYRLLPDAEELKEKLSPDEVFLLLASVWLHDIGMIPELFDGEEPPRGDEVTKERDSKVREEHAERSERYVGNNCNILGLFEGECDALMKICKFHRHREYKNLHEASKKYEDLSKDDRRITPNVALLTAYLRLADALHIPHKADVQEFKIYMALGLDPISKFHWLKSKNASEISVSQKEFKVGITLKRPPSDEYPNNWEEKMKPLEKAIEMEIQNEVDSIRDILIKGGLPIYLTAECKSEEFRNITGSDVRDLEEMLANIKLFGPMMVPNASAVIDAVLGQIKLLLDRNNERRSINLLKNYKINVLDDLVEKRPCHVFLWTIKELLEKNIQNSIRLTDEECITIIETINNKIGEWIKKREDILENLPKVAYGDISDGLSILLYGYSSSIVNCLEKAISEDKRGIIKKTEVYVCEGATKREYRYNNRLVYCDGIEYLKELERIGMENIHYVTDSCASNLFSKRKVLKVLFGANGIDYSGNVTHTLGHLAIADMASKHGVRVFIVADSMKIGYSGYSQQRAELQRGNQWLTTDIEQESKIEEFDKKNYNPREDIVPPGLIKAIITEKGRIPPTEIEKYAD